MTTRKEIDETIRQVRRELKQVADALDEGRRQAAYAAAEQAQFTCFELKDLLK